MRFQKKRIYKSYILTNFYFIHILDIKENYNKINVIHNLLINHKLTLREFSKFKSSFFINFV